MSENKYQKLAERTINSSLNKEEMIQHALFGMCGEIGELQSIYQKVYQSHEFDLEHAKKEIGDLLWFIAEWCTANEVDLDDIMDMNIEKLKNRYPKGFEGEKSINRIEGDI